MIISFVGLLQLYFRVEKRANICQKQLEKIHVVQNLSCRVKLKTGSVPMCGNDATHTLTGGVIYCVANDGIQNPTPLMPIVSIKVKYTYVLCGQSAPFTLPSVISLRQQPLIAYTFTYFKMNGRDTKQYVPVDKNYSKNITSQLFKLLGILQTKLK